MIFASELPEVIEFALMDGVLISKLGLQTCLQFVQKHTKECIVLPLYYDTFGKRKKCRIVEVASSH
jgi:hypothetical protein